MTILDRLFYHVGVYKMLRAEPRQKQKRIIKQLVRRHTPPSSRFSAIGKCDHGTSIDLRECDEDKLVFRTNRRHLDEGGRVLGWSAHKIIVSRDLLGRITIQEIPDYSDVQGEPPTTVCHDFERALAL